MCTAIYDGLTDRLAMKIGGKDKPDWVIERYWQVFADDIKVNYKLVRNRLAYMKEAVRDAAPATRDTFVEKHGECEVYEEILDIIEARAKKITNILSSEQGEGVGE